MQTGVIQGHNLAHILSRVLILLHFSGEETAHALCTFFFFCLFVVMPGQ